MRLGGVLSKLQSLGIDLGRSCSYTANLSRDLKIVCFPKGSAPLFLRIMDRNKGERDLRNLMVLKSRLGDCIVAPLEVFHLDDLTCGIFPYVAHRRITFKPPFRNSLVEQARDVLLAMHEGCEGMNPNCETLSLSQVAQFLSGLGLLPGVLKDYFETRFQQCVSELKQIPQHGDFTLTNLGISGRGKMMVFDWENVGLVNYPGFDLATFLLSFCFHAGSMHAITDGPEGLAKMVREDFGEVFLHRMGFCYETFKEVFPGYVALFLYLKSDFGLGIFERLCGVWKRLIQSQEWLVVVKRGERVA